MISPPLSRSDEPVPAFPLALRVATGTAAPIYRQLVDQVAVAVASGALAPGAKMPSVRAVADNLLINPNTVARAYNDLAQMGVLETQPGRGVYVAAAPAHQRYSDAERQDRLRRAAAQFVREIALLGFDKPALLQEIDHALDSALGQGERPSQPSAAQPELATAAGETTHA